jgi:DNA-binding transcriptional LysR family regulator
MTDAQLRAFGAFARTLSFTRAAEELHISQPVVSRHISELTARAGVPLTRRIGRRNELTPPGEYLANYVLQAEAMLEQAFRNVKQFSAQSGRVSVVASSTPGTYLLPAPMGQFLGHGAEVDLELTTAPAAAEAVRAHRFDLGVVGAFEPVADLESEPILHDELVFVGSPAMKGSTLSVAELESQTWINREEGTTTRFSVERLWRELGISPRRRLTLPSREAVKVAVAEGLGIGACTRFALDVELAAGTLTILQLAIPKLRRRIYLIKPRGVPLTPAASAFVDIVATTWKLRHPDALISEGAERVTSWL